MSDPVFEKYADVPCKFRSYYKYSFTFVGESADGAIITIEVGGCSEDIYRLDVNATSTATLRHGVDGLKPLSANVKLGDEYIYEINNY